MTGRLTTTLALALLLLFGALLALPAVEAAPDAARSSQNVIVNWSPETVAVTGTQTITPGRSLLLLTNAAALTLTLAGGGALPGDQLVVIGEVVTATVVQTNNTSLTAAQTISQNDVLAFVYANGQWVLVDDTDNAAD
jgi:hypothetical protein